MEYGHGFKALGQFLMPGVLLQLEYLFRILLAIFFGFLIGSERRKRTQSVATRTLTVVAFGASLMMDIR